MTPEQAANMCDSEVPYSADAGFPFTFVDENIKNGLVTLRNEGPKSLRVLRHSEDEFKAYQSHALHPGGYVEFVADDGEKIAFLDNREEIYSHERWDACIGVIKALDLKNYTEISNYEFGEGYVHPTKHTDETTSRLDCSEYVSADSYPGRHSVVEFRNDGSIPLDIFRLDSRGRKISPDGTERTIPDDFDPYNSRHWYLGLDPIETLQPGATFELQTRVGYAFEAIKRGTERMGREWREERGKVVDVLLGEPEICYGQLKVSQASETIAFSDELSREEFRRLADERKAKRQEDKRISSNLGLLSDADPAPNTVSESAGPGIGVGIRAFAVDGDEEDTVSYSGSYPFKIDESTGEVVVDQPLDREAAASYTIKVTATSSDGAISEAEFVVELEDADEFDVGPVTTRSWGWEDTSTSERQSSRQIWIDNDHTAYEDQPVGSTVILTALAEDKDATDEVRYSLSDDAGGLFAVDPVSGEVKTTRILDYEQAARHTIVVVATSTDGSQSSKTVSIVVADINDGGIGPVSDIDPAANAIMENSPAGTRVGIVLEASDPDTGETITYTYTSCVGCPGRDYEIDPATGVVTTSSSFEIIDLENPWRLADVQSLYFTAESSDGSSSSGVFEIEILDANEFEVTETQDIDRTDNQVVEDAAVGTPVGITAKALDDDAKATVSYQLSDDAGGRFWIDDQTGVITVAGPLDYETAQSHTVSVVSTSSDGSSSQNDFGIYVADLDEFQVGAVADVDNAPNIVSEGAPQNTPVGITALAEDGDASSTVRYSLEGQTSDGSSWGVPGNYYRGPIAIDAETGVVTTAWSAPDFETSPTLSFRIIATSDDGSTSQSQFTLEVTNVDEYDVGNLIDTDSTPNELDETAAIDMLAGITATAHDEDGVDQLSYSLADSSDGRFNIDSQTGIVTVAGELDAEEDERHYLVIVATSSDGSTTEENFL
ncbi:MAG: cadherin repeat domain-containing protein, partial [Rhodothermales bacterium]|nr:cadherin repeat domain-containing protein [Rhodothermales bacterium]